MAMISAVLSPYPVLLVILMTFIFGAEQLLFILGFCKVSEPKLISVIFPEGKIKIKLHDEPKIEGFLIGQQWCTHHAAVLRYRAEGGVERAVLLSRKQNADDYRRLSVCLQQDFCNDANKYNVSGNGPARRV